MKSHITVNKYTLLRLSSKANSVTTVRLEYECRQVPSGINLTHYKFYWFEDIECEREEDKSCGILTLRSRVVQRSGTFFLNAFVESYEDVKVKDEDMATRMANLNWKYIVQGITDNWVEEFKQDIDEVVENG